MSRARCALITGGGVRVGRAISSTLAGAGFHVAVHVHRSVSAGRALAAEIARGGGRCVLLEADLTAPGEAARLVASAVEALGRLDLVVNNAGLFASDDAPLRELAKLRLLNAEAPSSIAEAARPALLGSRGCLVDIADVAALERFESCRAYSLSKRAAVDRALERARRWAADGVRVNVICPGTVAPHTGLSPEQSERIRARIPGGAFGEPEDVARAVLFFADSPFVTGQVLCVDGGAVPLEIPRVAMRG